MTVTVSFSSQAETRLAAGLMTGNLDWDKKEHVYYITEESKRLRRHDRLARGRDLSVMPYQESREMCPHILSLHLLLKI